MISDRWWCCDAASWSRTAVVHACISPLFFHSSCFSRRPLFFFDSFLPTTVCGSFQHHHLPSTIFYLQRFKFTSASLRATTCQARKGVPEPEHNYKVCVQCTDGSYLKGYEVRVQQILGSIVFIYSYYLRGVTRDFRARHEPTSVRFSSPDFRRAERNKAAIFSISTQPTQQVSE